jgi:hypothetical protein
MSSKLDLELKKLFESQTIAGNTFNLEQINFESIEDAKLILDLRSRKSNNYLKSGSTSLQDQIEYLRKYQSEFERREQIYFKIFDKSKNSFNGLVRITELNKKNKFGWESMVVSEDVTPALPTDVMLSIFNIGFEKLEKQTCGPWVVTKENARVLLWHKKIGMSKICAEDENCFYLSVNSTDYFKHIDKYKTIGFGSAGFVN